MAGDWIKIEHATPDKPEVFQMSDALGIDPDAVIGKLIRVWVWADQQTYDGNARSVTQSLLDRCTGVTGFAKAMITAGWLLETSDGLLFANFDRHNGQTSKGRALTAKRVRKSRVTKVKRSCNAPSVTPSSLLLSYSDLRSKEEKSGTGGIPESLRTDAFGAAWDRWVQHREEIRKKLTPTSVGRQLKRFETWGAARSIAAIDHTVANGWQGIREPDTAAEGKPIDTRTPSQKLGLRP